MVAKELHGTRYKLKDEVLTEQLLS